MEKPLESDSPMQNLLLPQLEIKPVRHVMGWIRHALAEGGAKEVVSIRDVYISPRRKEKLYILSDGQKIIVTSRKKLNRPDGVDGVLRISDGDQPKWLSHKLVEQFNQKLASGGWKALKEEVAKSWNAKFIFHAEEKDAAGNIISSGLRPAQIGGLHAIGSHWSLYKQPATVVMPTGTGKTETMLATLVAYMSSGTLLVVVPSQILRDQTAKKFFTLGLLRMLGNLEPGVQNPIIGVIRRRPRSQSDLKIFEDCNVVIGTMSALGESSSAKLTKAIAQKISALIVDEAHHIGAAGWAAFREHFTDKKILQFTATPYRRDGKLVDGKVIYEYPLHTAQQDGYFKKISFEPVYEIDQEAGDRAIAQAAVKRLKEDEAKGFNHLIMARCANIGRAKIIYKIYQSIAPDLNPVMVHTEYDDSTASLDSLRAGQSRIVVCVNMLGEGFDLPQLKIAAVHDTHKSLAVLLQFTGRFTRSAGTNIGDATVVANIADQDVSSALERLYSEDADWNQLLSEFSSEASKAHAALVEFLNSSQRLDEADDTITEISHHLLHPTMSTLVYEANSFSPKEFFKGLSKYTRVHSVWLHQDSNTLYFVTKTEPLLKWSRSRQLRDRQWDLFVLHYDQEQHLLFLSSSDHSSPHEKLANVVGATKLISGDNIFRTLSGINRLIFQQIGVRKHGRRNLRYAMYTGADVAEALSISERAGSVKSNLNGSGWENGRPVTIGCSYKGRVWSREQGSIPEFVEWCGGIGKKLLDNSIDTRQIIANVLIPEEVEGLPDKEILSMEWPLEIMRQSEERIVLHRGEEELPLSMFDLNIVGIEAAANKVNFQISSADEAWVSLTLTVGGTEGFRVTRSSATPIMIQAGSLTLPIEEYFSNYPPMVRFVDLSELDGNLLIRPQSTQQLVFPQERFEAWDWQGVDTSKESYWKNGNARTDSIQWRAAQQFIDGGFDIVFDDDAAGEAADLVCLKEEQDYIRLVLIHCKFTQGADGGGRVKDVVDVCSQAVRSAKWKWKFKDLCRHILGREKRLTGQGRPTRFLKGQTSSLNKYVKISRFKEIRAEIIIVQPGLSKENCTAEQTAILASAHSYLKETVGVDLDVICSA